MQSSNRELTTVLLTSGGCLYRGEAHDVEHVNSAGPLLMHYRQIEPGRFRSSGVLLVLPNLVAGVGSVNRGTVAQGTLLEKHIGLHGSETPSLSCDFSQQTLGPGVLAVIAPDCEVELYSRQGRRGFSVAVCPKLWVRTADALGLGGAPVTGARLVPVTAARWTQLLHGLNWISEAIEAYPDSFEEPSIRNSVEQDLVQRLIVTIGRGHEHEPRPLSAPARAQALRRIRGHVQEHLEWPITLADLCRVASLGARSLQIIFREKLGVSPMQYVRAERLNRAHALLRGSFCRNVSEAARLSGYWHMAQFTADYRKMFHETPSSTLQRGRHDQAADRCQPQTGAGRSARAGL